MDRKELIREYKETHRPMGVFQIRNIGSSVNIPGKINRHRFALNAGLHASRSLQADWHEFGAERLEFEVLEDVAPRENPDYDYKSDLEVLEDLWLEKLEPYGASGYNEKKKTRDERLRMIAENRRSQVS
jgi:hypothetical protein